METYKKYLTEVKPGELGGLNPKTRKLLSDAYDAMDKGLYELKNDIKRTNYGQKGKLDNIEKRLLSDHKQADIQWGKIWQNIVRLARDIETGY